MITKSAIVAAALMLSGCGQYYALDPQHPPTESGYLATVSCELASGYSGTGGLAEALAYHASDGPAQQRACMRAKGFDPDR